MESGNAHQDDGLRTHPAVSLNEGDNLTDGKKLSSFSSISSLSSSSSGNPLGLDDDETTKHHRGDRIGTPKDDTQLGSKGYEDDSPVSSMAWQEEINSPALSSTNGSATELPPMQVMERPADPNRIPSSVFARNRSTAPMEWSVASNESLFSLHTGNMSFTSDHIFWLSKSGELGLPGDCTTSSPDIDFSSNQPELSVTGQRSVSIDRDFGVSESKSAETMREVIKENEDSHSKEKYNAKALYHSASLPRHSDGSGASIKSFAFQILTDDKIGSVHHKRHPSSRPHSQPATPKVSQQPKSPPQTPKQESTTPKGTPNEGQGKWFSCFPLCRFCS